MTHISLRDGYVYFKIPKVASSTLALTLSHMEVRDFQAVKPKPHPGLTGAVFTRPYQLPDAMANEALGGATFKRFAFVRHPYSRLLSAYNHRIIQEKTHTKMQILTHLYGPKYDIDTEVGFDDFLTALAKIPANKMDPHFRPQTTMLGHGTVNLTFLGRMENLKADMEAMADHIGLPVMDYLTEELAHKTGAAETWQDHATPDRIRKVIALYGTDLEAYGYDL